MAWHARFRAANASARAGPCRRPDEDCADSTQCCNALACVEGSCQPPLGAPLSRTPCKPHDMAHRAVVTPLPRSGAFPARKLDIATGVALRGAGSGGTDADAPSRAAGGRPAAPDNSFNRMLMLLVVVPGALVLCGLWRLRNSRRRPPPDAIAVRPVNPPLRLQHRHGNA